MAAELHGSGMLVLAVAVLLIPGVLTGRRPDWILTIAAIVVFAAVAGIALPTLLSGLAGEVVSLPHMWLPAILYLIGLPVLLIVSGARAAPASSRVSLARFATVLLLIVANNVIILHLMVVPAILMYSSYDTTPWAEAVGGVFLIAAAVAIWLTSSRDPVPAASDGGSVVLQHARLTQTG
jgi:hypothetical protein